VLRGAPLSARLPRPAPAVCAVTSRVLHRPSRTTTPPAEQVAAPGFRGLLLARSKTVSPARRAAVMREKSKRGAASPRWAPGSDLNAVNASSEDVLLVHLAGEPGTSHGGGRRSKDEPASAPPRSHRAAPRNVDPRAVSAPIGPARASTVAKASSAWRTRPCPTRLALASRRAVVVTPHTGTDESGGGRLPLHGKSGCPGPGS